MTPAITRLAVPNVSKRFIQAKNLAYRPKLRAWLIKSALSNQPMPKRRGNLFWHSLLNFYFNFYLKSKKVKKMTRALNKEQRASRLLLSILCVFIVLWLPYNIMALYASRNGFQSIPTWAWSLGYWLCYLNSTLNPACYAACNQVIFYHYPVYQSLCSDLQTDLQRHLDWKDFPA